MYSLGCFSTPNLETYSMYQGSGSTIPEEYRIKDLGDILDQGSKGCCVSCSIYEIYNFYCLSKGKKVDIPYTYTYDNRKDKSLDGQNPGEGFTFMKNQGKINVFSRIGNLDSLKEAIIANGPCALAMIVRNTSGDTNFWRGSETNPIGHMVAVIGYTKDSFIIKNSWGYSYGDSGYAELPYEDFNAVREAWTIIA